MPTELPRVQALFLAAADLADPAARAAYLDRECDGDAPLRARVEALLRAHGQPDSLLDAPVVPAAGGETRTHAPAAPELDQTRTHADAAADELADALAFLAPPGRPDSLGRIGHYEVLEVLGRGGFGIVYRAFDDVLQRVVAVKVLAPSMAVTSPARKRFLREAQSSAKVRHENAVQIYEIGEQPLPYLVMEFVPGETLQQQLDRTGPLDVPEVLRVGRQIAAGLAAAHGTGLVHRDIKPSNILIGGPGGQVKITDFGLARAADDASLTRSGAVAGTPMYMSPEQARGEKVDARTDLFSLGSVLYAMLTGRPPFRATTTLAVLNRVAEDQPRPIREVIPEVPAWLCRIVEKLHAKDPAGRFQTAREVADVLADCERQLRAHRELKDFARIPEPTPRPVRRRSRSPVLVVVLVLLGLMGCLGLAGVAVLVGYWLMPMGAAPNPRGGLGPEVVEQVDRPDAADAGWVSLFNGKDLAGWRPPEGQGEWKVVGNALTGTAAAGDYGILATGREYANFHLRAEVRLTGPGNSGILFRSENGYQAEIDQRTTGSIARSKPFAWLDPKEHTLVEPGAWFQLEVIADGPRFTSKVNGQVVADVTDRGPTRGYVALELNGRQNGALVVEFRKVEIRELPPGDARPFVLVEAAGKPGRLFATLAEAVEAAPAGGVVEVRGDGPFVTPGVAVRRPLTIRAGAESRPVIEHDKSDEPNGALIATEAGLVLEGLELRATGASQRGPRTLVHVTGGPLAAANCRFVTSRGLTRAVGSARVEFRNCEFLSAWVQAAAIDWTDAPSKGVLRMANCVTTNWALFLHPGPQAVEGARIEFRDNTFAQAYLLSCYSGGELLGDGKRPPPFHITATNNVLQSGQLFRVEIERTRADLADWPLDRVDRLARALLDWKGDANVCLPTSGYDLWHGNAAGNLVRTVKTRAAWKAEWGANDAGTVEAEVRFRGPVRQKAGTAQQQLTAADFRLADDSPTRGAGPGGRDPGADVDLVGPGPAYERWKKSADYPTWAAATKP